VHCYLTERRQPELTVSECEGILDQLAEAGVMTLLFSGGDLFLRPDAVDILWAARRRDFDVKINTHGNFIDDTLADAIAEMGLARVALSVYSDDPAEHDAVTLIPGSHAKTLAAARRLIARDVPTHFKTPVMEHNREGFHRVADLANAMGVTYEIDGHIVADDQSDFGLCSIGVHMTDRLIATLKALEPRRHEAHRLDTLPDAPSSKQTCSAGTVSGYISPDGRLWPCINWRESIGDLRQKTFAALWWSDDPVLAKQRTIRRASYLEGGCDGCTFHGKCGYCPGISHAETGDAGKRSLYVCERTHITMAAIEHLDRLNDAGAPVPDPGTPEADALLDSPPTFAERQWAARKGGFAKPGHALPIGQTKLVHISEPKLVHISEPKR
jgi:MoaA/NifB/PqqE/SkfB family radical SAM enzyme